MKLTCFETFSVVIAISFGFAIALPLESRNHAETMRQDFTGMEHRKDFNLVKRHKRQASPAELLQTVMMIMQLLELLKGAGAPAEEPPKAEEEPAAPPPAESETSGSVLDQLMKLMEQLKGSGAGAEVEAESGGGSDDPDVRGRGFDFS